MPVPISSRPDLLELLTRAVEALHGAGVADFEIAGAVQTKLDELEPIEESS